MHQIRVIEQNGEPWFVGKDVAEALGYKEPTKAARERVEAEDRGGVYFRHSWRKTGNDHHQRIRSLHPYLSPAPLQLSILYMPVQGSVLSNSEQIFQKGGELFYFENTKKIGIAGM